MKQTEIYTIIGDGVPIKHIFDVPSHEDQKNCTRTCKSGVNSFSQFCKFERCIFHERNREYLVLYVQQTVEELEVCDG